MTVDRHAVEVRTFARYLRDLAALLDPGRGWYGVFVARDPEGMRACLDGTEVPPWDVVESLLQDLAAVRGTGVAARESVRAAALYTESAAAHDRRPGGRRALADRLDLMLHEQAAAAQRLRALAGPVAGGPDAEPEEAAWARDDLARATARCAELSHRLAAVGSTVPDGWLPPADPAPPPVQSPPAPDPHRPEDSHASLAPAPRRERKRPRGARFAGLDAEDGTETAPLASPVPVLPPPAPTTSAPRGARYGGAPARRADAAPPAPEADPAVLRAAEETVGLLGRLRAEGRTGEAHAVLCEAADGPAGQLPVLAVALHRAGLAADWATLLWELSSLPPAALAAAAGALAAAGRAEDCAQVLRQGVARPAREIADAVAALDLAGRQPEALALLGAFVRVRTPQDAAHLAEAGAQDLVPQLLAAAREVSAARERDVCHALRVAGIATP
ncbi:hypothetical protein [Streptomyces salyersiae]|uniref:UL36 very large tegument protein n=1 Tax=Streptomyces salyersiae TaxID=3075530 RepID=A0ABU2RHR6_9ACTN|nr:hypothetical protein [Streptomyces sp. DSM 41770]MDT0427018.1 hypothetical protein [Streptomyces sp. DSM 41770]